MKPVGFSDAACLRSLRKLTALINAAGALSDRDLSERAATFSINFNKSVIDPILNYPKVYPIEDVDLIRRWSMSDGKPDRSPIRLHEVNLLKGEKGVALYQFTLRRDAYNVGISEEDAANDSCGMGAVPAFYDHENASYLGLFMNNKLREVSAFDAWLRKV